MQKWGIGIEHEMRVRFKKTILDLPKDIVSKYFIGNQNEYIFIHSELLLYYYSLYEVIVMKDYKKYITNELSDKESDYFNTILLKVELIKLAKKKIKFPLDDTKFFDLEKNEKSMELLKYYLMVYALFHSPLLFFSYDFNGEIIMDFKNFTNYNTIADNLNKLYDNSLELDTNNYLKKLFNKKNIRTYSFNYIGTELKIKFNFSNTNTNNLEYDIFLNDIDIYIKNIREIFNNNFLINDIGYNKFYKNLFILYTNNIPHIDYTSKTSAIEFKTINYENMNYETALNDLIELEKTFFYLVNNIPIFNYLTNLFGELIYHNIGSVKNTVCIYDLFNIYYYNVTEDYTGSYHLWITTPYTEETPMDSFINTHVHLANKLQLLEPILAAHYTSPSYNAFNNNESNASLRQFLNSYSNYGTSDITLMYGAKKYNFVEYYLSEEDIYNNKTFIPYENDIFQSSIYDNDGKLIINYDKLATRFITNNIFSQINKGNEESNNINIQNYFLMIFEKTQIRPKTNNKNVKYLGLGADIRTRNLNDYIYPLNKEWRRCLVMKKNKFVEVYYNDKLKEISYERVYNEDNYKKDLLNRVGIEFRIFDHFPTIYLNQILSLLVPVVLDSLKNKKKLQFKNTYISKQFWHNEMFNVITKGYEYTLGNKYLNVLEKEFNVKFKNKISIDTSTALKELYDQMSKQHKSILYNKMKFHSKIEFINFNKKAWSEIIKKFFDSNKVLLDKILYLNKDSSNSNIIDILGTKYQYDLTKIKNYLENITPLHI